MPDDVFTDSPNARRMMTHFPERPNPTRPYIEGVKAFSQGGVAEVLRRAGITLPEWSNRFGAMLQNPDNVAAMGMAVPPARLGFSSAGAKRVAGSTPATVKPVVETSAEELTAQRAQAKKELQDYVAKVEAKEGKPKTLADLATSEEKGRIGFSSAGAKKLTGVAGAIGGATLAGQDQASAQEAGTKFIITSPDGTKKFQINAPAGTTQDQAFEYFKTTPQYQQFGGKSGTETEQAPLVRAAKGAAEVGTDIAKSAPRAAYEGLISSLVRPLGSLPQLAEQGISALTGLQPTKRSQAVEKGLTAIEKKLEAPVQGLPTPQTATGKVAAGAIGAAASPSSYVGAAASGPAWAVVSALGAGAGAELGGQMTGDSLFGRIMGGAIGGLAGGTRRPVPTIPPASSVQDLFTAGNQAYEAVKLHNRPVPVQQSMALSDKITDALHSKAISRIDPALAGVFDQIDKLAAPRSATHITTNELFEIQKTLNGVVRRSPNTEKALAANVARRQILDFLRASDSNIRQLIDIGDANWRAASTARGLHEAVARGESVVAGRGTGARVEPTLLGQLRRFRDDRSIRKTPEEMNLLHAMINADDSRFSRVRIARALSQVGSVQSQNPLAHLRRYAFHMIHGGYGLNVIAAHVASMFGDRAVHRGVERFSETIRRNVPGGTPFPPGYRPLTRTPQRVGQVVRGAVMGSRYGGTDE